MDERGIGSGRLPYTTFWATGLNIVGAEYLIIRRPLTKTSPHHHPPFITASSHTHQLPFHNLPHITHRSIHTRRLSLNMDFPEPSSYPIVVNTDYSPTTEVFPYPDIMDKAYLADGYTTQPDYSLDSFFDCPVTSIEQPVTNFASTSSKRQSLFDNTLPATSSSYQTSFCPSSYGTVEQFVPTSNFSFEPTTADTFDTSPINASPTPSLCGDGAQAQLPASPSLSPRSLKRESPDDTLDIETTEPATKRPQRKRGRPRLDRTSTIDSTSTVSTANLKSKQSHRLPHNQVERKYREGLNSELERLRRAVPTLPQSDEANVMGQPKPSKAMVLAGAIDYIKRIERERDAALDELDRLRKAQMQNYRSWGNGEEEEFTL